MIFVTVGTHEQPFNRLVEEVDRLKGEGIIEDDVIIQKGYSTYSPKHCQYFDMLPYDQMEAYQKEARIIITHGGPASFIYPISIGKKPIVVPRQSKYNEHVNDHQLEFCQNVVERNFPLLVVEKIEELEEFIKMYNQQNEQNMKFSSNNANFQKKLIENVKKIFE